MSNYFVWDYPGHSSQRETSKLRVVYPWKCQLLVYSLTVCFVRMHFSSFYSSNQHPMQRQTTFVSDCLASVCHVCLLTCDNSTPEIKGKCQNYFMRLICYCVVVTMFKFEKHHFLDKIYSFVIFATNFKTIILTILEDFDVLILLTHLRLKVCHHVTEILQRHWLKLVRGAIILKGGGGILREKTYMYIQIRI